MKTGFELLEELGSQEIYERTHITCKTINSIIAKDFDDISTVQFNGFIKIIEREFNLDLRELKIEYNLSQNIEVEVEKEKEIAPVIKKESHVKKYIFFALLFVAITLFFLLKVEHASSDEESYELNNSYIELAKTNIASEKERIVVENNISSATVSSEINSNSIMSSIDSDVMQKVENFYIYPKANLWIGIIDLTTHKKQQFTTKEPIELNSSKSYLFTLGHGFVTFELDNEEFDYSEKTNTRFYYEPYKLKKINRNEFKKYNKGKSW